MGVPTLSELVFSVHLSRSFLSYLRIVYWARLGFSCLFLHLTSMFVPWIGGTRSYCIRKISGYSFSNADSRDRLDGKLVFIVFRFGRFQISVSESYARLVLGQSKFLFPTAGLNIGYNRFAFPSSHDFASLSFWLKSPSQIIQHNRLFHSHFRGLQSIYEATENDFILF